MRRPTDFYARYGGEEFAVIVDSDLGGAMQLAQLLNKAIKELAIDHKAVTRKIVTVSIGVASLVPVRGATANLLIQQADEALYLSKANGRDRVTPFTGKEQEGVSV